MQTLLLWLGVFMGGFLKAGGPDAVAALVEGIRRGMADNAENGKPLPDDLQQRAFDDLLWMRDAPHSPAAGDGGSAPEGNQGRESERS